MNPRHPFQTTFAAAVNASQGYRKQMDISAIDQILGSALRSENPINTETAMTEILKRVSPERRDQAFAILENRNKKISEQQRQKSSKEAYEKAGLDPSIADLDPKIQKSIIDLKNKSAENDISKKDSAILARYAAGEEVPVEELSSLSPTSLRSIIAQKKPVFESTGEKIEAERVSQLATEIESEYKAAQSEDQRLGRMEELSKEGNLSTPLMVKTMGVIGLPIGILGNPDTEEFTKLEADYLRDVSKVFPGGRVTNYEVQAYLKSIPSLVNSEKGRAAIVRNRRLQNKARKLRYDAYKEVLSENKGIKPRNMGFLINEKIGTELQKIEEEFQSGINDSLEKFQQTIKLKDSKGKIYNIPPNKIEEALKDGFSFQ